MLSLRRGCIEYDKATKLWLMHGRKWKGAGDEYGMKIPEGQERKHPWVVGPPVARAIRVLERLYDGELLFPAVVLRKLVGRERARTYGEVAEVITELIE